MFDSCKQVCKVIAVNIIFPAVSDNFNPFIIALMFLSVFHKINPFAIALMVLTDLIELFWFYCCCCCCGGGFDR